MALSFALSSSAVADHDVLPDFSLAGPTQTAVASPAPGRTVASTRPPTRDDSPLWPIVSTEGRKEASKLTALHQGQTATLAAGRSPRMGGEAPPFGEKPSIVLGTPGPSTLSLRSGSAYGLDWPAAPESARRSDRMQQSCIALRSACPFRRCCPARTSPPPTSSRHRRLASPYPLSTPPGPFSHPTRQAPTLPRDVAMAGPAVAVGAVPTVRHTSAQLLDRLPALRAISHRPAPHGVPRRLAAPATHTLQILQGSIPVQGHGATTCGTTDPQPTESICRSSCIASWLCPFS